MVRINLLPPEYRPQPQIKPIRLLALLLLILAPMILAGFAVNGYFQIQALRGEIAQIQQKRADLGPIYDDVVNMERTLNAVQGKLAAMEKVTANHLDPAEFLKALNGIVPENVAITNLSLAAGGRIAMMGNATDYYGVAALQLKMIVSDAFRDVILSNASGEDRISFQLSSIYSAGSASSQADTRDTGGGVSAQNTNTNRGSAGAGTSRSPASASPGQAPAGSDSTPESDSEVVE